MMFLAEIGGLNKWIDVYGKNDFEEFTFESNGILIFDNIIFINKDKYETVINFFNIHYGLFFSKKL